MVRDTAQLSTPSPERDVPVKPEQELVDQFQLLEAAKVGGKDTLIATFIYSCFQAMWVLEGSKWDRQCDGPEEVPDHEVCFCAVADGFVQIGGNNANGQIHPVCYHYTFSERKWRRLPDMITPKKKAEAVEISPMVVMVLGGENDKNRFSTECEILNVMEGEWSSVKPLPEYMISVRVAAAGGRVFIMGQHGDYKAPNYELLKYNTSTDTYTKIQIDLPAAGSDSSHFHSTEMVAVAGKLYLVGGINIEYDIATQHVTQLPEPKASYPSGTNCCPTVRGKNILLCGGIGREYNCTAMEEYNTTTHQWRMLDVSLPFVYFKGTSFVANISV